MHISPPCVGLVPRSLTVLHHWAYFICDFHTMNVFTCNKSLLSNGAPTVIFILFVDCVPNLLIVLQTLTLMTTLPYHAPNPVLTYMYYGLYLCYSYFLFMNILYLYKNKDTIHISFTYLLMIGCLFSVYRYIHSRTKWLQDNLRC